MTPGERADARCSRRPILRAAQNVLRWVPTERGYGSTYNRSSEPMLAIETVADAPVIPEPIPTELRTIEPIDIANATQRTLDLTIAIASTVEMGVNGVPYWQSKPFEINLGDTEVWRIVNNTDFSHPFHLHGYFFQVLDETPRAGVEGHRQRSDEVRAHDRRALRRAAGHLDVPLSHPRPRGGRDDGPSRRSRSQRAGLRDAAGQAPSPLTFAFSV